MITEQNRAGIHGRIPGRSTADTAACPACGLDLAADLLAADAAKLTGSLVILVTASSGREDTDKLERSAGRLANAGAPVYAIAFRAADMPAALVTVTQQGKIFVLDEEDGEDSRQLANIADAFMTIKGDGPRLAGSGGEGGVRKFYEHQVRSARPNDRIEGKLTVEDSLRRNLRVMAVTAFKEDIELFELVSPSGQVHKFPIVERGSVHFEFEESVEAGIWTYALKLAVAKSSSNGVAVSVMAYAEASADSTTVSASVWTSHEGELATPTVVGSPILIYAQVTDGLLPVLGAEVVALIRQPGGSSGIGSSSSSVVSEIRLMDSGTGYPDMTQGDGIYSAYLTTFSSEAGFYSLAVRARDGNGAARIPSTALSPALADSDCCGSRYPVTSTIPTPSFTRIVMGSSFYLTQGIPYFIRDGVPVMSDLFPPSRITDLRVASGKSDVTASSGPGTGSAAPTGLETVLLWTAPGGDFNVGPPAARYEIRCYTGREALSEANFSRSGIPVHEVAVPAPMPPGTAESALVSLPWPNEIFYYGIVAVDEAGNRGPVSNLVAAFAPEPVAARVANGGEDSSAAGNGTSLSLAAGSSLPSTVMEVRWK